MSLKKEIGLNREFHSKEEELLLGMIYTNQLLEKVSNSYLKQFGLTATQFNALMIIRDYESEGLRQVDLSRLLLINRASVGTLIDKLTKMGLIERKAVPGDRRAYNLVLKRKGHDQLKSILPNYYGMLKETLGAFSAEEANAALGYLQRFRNVLIPNLPDDSL